MALNPKHLRFVLLARSRGVRFDRVLMIGRQELYVDAASLRRTLAAGGIQLDDNTVEKLLEDEDGFAEPLLRLIGATHVDSMDVSSYEDATIVHDLNRPIALSLRDRYSVVIDSGSLEHVFNVPQALRNCLEMVEEGGHFISIGPANNAMGHGFYQFSPEFYFRILSPQNGFRIERIFAVEMHADAPWYAVSDPAVVGHRVEWQSLSETHLMVCAKKERTVEICQAVPQQSDYMRHWTRNPNTPATEGPAPVHRHVDQQSLVPRHSLRERLWQPVPPRAKTAYRRLKHVYKVVRRALSHPDPACFTRIEMPQLTSD